MKDQRISVNDLAELTGLTPRRIQQLAEQGVIPKPETGEKYSLLASIGGLVRYYRDSSGEATKEDRARLAKTNADNAELEGMRMRGEVVMLTDAKAWWSGERIEIKRTVERAEYLTPTQKTRLLLSFGKMKTKGP